MCVSSQSHPDSVSGSHDHPRPPGQREACREGVRQRPRQPRGPGCVAGALSHSTERKPGPCSSRQEPSREHRFLRLAAVQQCVSDTGEGGVYGARPRVTKAGCCSLAPRGGPQLHVYPSGAREKCRIAGQTDPVGIRMLAECRPLHLCPQTLGFRRKMGRGGFPGFTRAGRRAALGSGAWGLLAHQVASPTGKTHKM